MGVHIVWTPDMDRRLMSLREAGRTWNETALDMGLGRNTVLERGRKIGARKLGAVRPVAVTEDADRRARPPGHPETWGLINTGTVLEGAPYPFPVFL